MKTLICITSVLLMFACAEKSNELKHDRELKEIDSLADKSDSLEIELRKLEEERNRL